MKPQQEVSNIAGANASSDLLDQPSPRIEQDVKLDRLNRHSDELLIILGGNIKQMRLKQFVRRAWMANEIDEEGAEQIVADSFLREQIVGVEQIPGMLAIERSSDLAGIEVGEGDELDFGESESLFDGLADSA